MEHLGVGEPLGLLDQQTGCCDKLGFGKQRPELAHGTHRSAASRPIAPQPEPAVSPMRYQRAPHSRRIGAVASSPRSWTIASPMPTPPRSSSTMSRRTPSPARHGRAGAADRNRQNRRGQLRFKDLQGGADGFAPRAGPEDLSLLLYTSGTTGRPKGVPRRHRAERAAALAHIAQNLYARGERRLGVMPLYHTMGVRSLLAMGLLDGTFVCLPRFEAGAALRLIARERISNLYLVSTLDHAPAATVSDRVMRPYEADADKARKFLARPGDVPVHRLKAWLNAPIS